MSLKGMTHRCNPIQYPENTLLAICTTDKLEEFKDMFKKSERSKK